RGVHADSARRSVPVKHRARQVGRCVPLALLCATIAMSCAAGRAQDAVSSNLWDTGTFSILGYDPDTGEVGAAVQSRVFSVGNGVLWAEANVGVVATQAVVDVGYGPRALELLRRGLQPAAIVRQVRDDDPDPLPENWTKQGRQFAVMNAKGEYAARSPARKRRSGPATRAESSARRRETSSPDRRSSPS